MSSAGITIEKILGRLTVNHDLKWQDLKGWTPIKIQFLENGPVVVWANLQQVDFVAYRFFQQIVKDQVAADNYRNRVIVTPIDVLLNSLTASPGLEPKGFVFHVSRCGSTLLSNMLAALPQNLVIVEPGPVNKILAFSQKLSEPTRRIWLKAMVSALGQPRLAKEQNYFIKFSSWNVLHWPLIRAVFPHTPFVLLYRDPVEVMVSHLNNPGGWMRAQGHPHSVQRRVQLSAAEISRLDTEAYCARVLGNLYEAMAQCNDDQATPINYSELTRSHLPRLWAFLGLEASEQDMTCMADQLHFYSKDSTQRQIFQDDRHLKQTLASLNTRGLIDQWVTPHYEKLEAAKLRPISSAI